MANKQILFYKPGTLATKDREKLTKAGYVCVESNDFEAYKLVDPCIPQDRMTILKAAMWAITNAGTDGEGPKTKFGKKLAELLDLQLSDR